MLLILFLIIAQILRIDTLQTTRPVAMILDGFTVESWNKQFIWNQTRTMIVHHLNSFCKHDRHCDAEYGIDNIHLLAVNQYGFSSIYLNITADEPIQTSTTIPYNYTALLTGAIFQAKIDIEHVHDNQLFNSTLSSTTKSSDQNSVLNRTSRLLFVLLGIALVTIVFALTILFFQRIHKHNYSRLLKATQACQQTQDERLNQQSPSISPLN